MVRQVGLKLVRQGHRSAAAAVAPQLSSYGRPSEVIGLHGEDLIAPSGRGAKYLTPAVIFHSSDRGEVSKTGAADDTIMIDAKCPAHVGRLVRLLRSATPLTQRVFDDLTLSKYEVQVRAAAVALSLPAEKFVPHAFRHSGPSNDFYNKRRDILEIQMRGRWASHRSVARYQKAGRLLGFWQSLKPAARFQAQRDSALFGNALLEAWSS